MTPFLMHFCILQLPTLIHCPLGGEGGGGGEELDSIIIVIVFSYLKLLLALQTIETLHLPLSYHLLPTNPHQGKESQRVQLPHGSIDDMTTKVITQHLTAPSKLIRLKLSQ